MFQLPALVLSVLISSIESIIFFIWQGKTVRAFAAYWVAGVLGFLAGQGLAIILHFNFLLLGQIHIIEGILVCAIALFVAKLLKM